jgi:hypothetical protein
MQKKHNDDKLLTTYYNARDYFDKNKRTLYIALTVLIVIIAGVILYFNKKSANEDNAALALSKIQPAYDNQEFNIAMNGDSLGSFKGLVYIVNEYGSTQSGELAKILLANCYYYTKDYGSAQKLYNDYGGSNEILKAAALAGSAAVNEASNNFSEAAKQYEKAADVNKDVANNDEYLYYAIRNYSKANDQENVNRVIKELKADYPKSQFIIQVDKYKG